MTLLAAVDYSELSQLVVKQTIELAGRYAGAEAHFVHVSDEAPKALGTGARRNERLLAWLGDQLVDLGQELGGLPNTVRVVGHEASGDPIPVILQLAGDLLADMVLVGTRGRTGVERILMGSVAESVMRQANCPVLVVRAKTHDDPVAQIEPPCPQCLEARLASGGEELWCEQHGEKRGRRQSYYGHDDQSWTPPSRLAS